MKNLKWFLLVLLVAIFLIPYLKSKGNNNQAKPQNSQPSQMNVSKSSQEIQIESKGLKEFNQENNTINTVTPVDKQLAKEMGPGFKAIGDGKDVEKNEEAISFFNKVIEKHPEYADAYFIRAGLSVYIGNRDYQKILSDVDNAIRYFSSSNYKSAFDSTAVMYSLRAKVDILSGSYQQAIDDLFTAVKIDPDKMNNVFNTGGVKPEDESNPSAIQISDLDKLISLYPNDYRTYLYRGLFYNVFSTYGGEKYFTLAINDLQQSLTINPNSALTNYFLGSVYVSMTFWTKAGASDVSDLTGKGGGYRDKTNETALNYFKEAIKCDSQFVNAYSQIAESLFSLKRYSEAIPYYDKVIELNPNIASAYNDRGLAKTNTNDFYGAISDFSDSIKLKQSKPDSMLDNTYKNRADAYLKISDYESAIDDYSRAIGLKFAQLVYLMSVPQIRAIYPEFNDISDQDLLEGFHQKYFSNMTSSDFLGNYANNKKPYEDNIIADLYVNRGDSYWAEQNFRKACQEYMRAISEDSSYGLPRWKSVTKDSNSESSIDLQTLDFSKNGFVSIWIQTIKTADQSSDKINYDIDCSGRRIKVLTGANYDSQGNPDTTMNPDSKHEWQTIIPDSLGEYLYTGMCK